MKIEHWTGPWKWVWELRVDWRSIGIGVQFRLFSWRSAYPWLYFGVAFPFLGFNLDLTRPDHITVPKPAWSRAG